MDEHVHDPDVLGDLGRGNQAGEDELAGEVAPQDLVLEGFAVFAVHDQEEPDPWKVADEVGSDGDEVLVALVVEEAGDLAHHEILGGQAEARAETGVVTGAEEGIEVEAADDAGELVGVTDAGRVVLAGHGVGDDDEVGGEMSGDAFGGPEKSVGGGSLEWAERGAVDGVEDQGDAGGAGGEASHDAGLSAVGMDDVGLTSAQLGGEGDPGAEVEHGADPGGGRGRERV